MLSEYRAQQLLKLIELEAKYLEEHQILVEIWPHHNGFKTLCTEIMQIEGQEFRCMHTFSNHDLKTLIDNVYIMHYPSQLVFMFGR